LSLSAEILRYIDALKWPVVATGGVYYFRTPLYGVLDRIAASEWAPSKVPAAQASALEALGRSL
jgi:hypothetical protein